MRLAQSAAAALVIGSFAALVTAPASAAQSAQVVQSAWRTACSTDAKSAWRCQMSRTVPAPNKKGALMQMVIVRSADDKKTFAQFLVPLAVYLPSGVSFTLPKGKPQKVGYTTCSNTGCVAPLLLDKALLDQLKKGGKLDVRFVMKDRKSVDVGIDLKGFASAYDKLIQKK